ncbi:MAG: GNAT family N-acetyltransferase, partial [Treponema sp.]|nr:GNAT family N-acetyltransferase [Treponema sp.]
MQFELTEALIEDILFSMEDQMGDFLLDTRQGIVVNGSDPSGEDEEDEEDEDRYINLPDWDSSDGYRLMEKFAAGFRNPLVRGELCAALNQGRGVFRAFKDTLGRYSEAEKLWFSFKDREMKKEILDWYNGLREEWGLSRIGGEPEDTGDLVLEDFRFRPYRAEDAPSIEALHRYCRGEFPEALKNNGTETGPVTEEGPDLTLLSPAHTLTAETSGGEFAGYCSASLEGKRAAVKLLEVKAEYRGLGLGEALLTGLLERLASEKVSAVLVDLPSPAAYFSRILEREGFK